MFFPVFGKNPTGPRLAWLRGLSNYKKNGFENQSVTPMLAPDASYYKVLGEYFKPHKGKQPPAPLVSVKRDLAAMQIETPVITWFGHSSYLVQGNGLNILVDPVFRGNASPFSFMVKAFPGADVYTVADMPPLDYLLLTHDHYDHLDYKTVIQLKDKVKGVICSAGLGSHLAYWGFDEALIREPYWWETLDLLNGNRITATPARHFSGRGSVRGKTLWSSFVLQLGHWRLFLGGDSGYDTHFREIGEKFGPFDIAILESGQYNSSWPFIHMMPEETVQAAIDLRAKVLMPVHWGKFVLAFHPWDEPIRRIVQAAAEIGQKITTPMIGEAVVLDQVYPAKSWWNQ